MVHSFFTNKNLAANEMCYPLSTSLAYKVFNRRGVSWKLKNYFGDSSMVENLGSTNRGENVHSRYCALNKQPSQTCTKSILPSFL